MSETAPRLAAAVAADADPDLSGLDLSGVFQLLSDETRLTIVRELALVHADEDCESSLAFSELRRRVGTSDSGRFNYHLRQLCGSLVEKAESGYELTELGLVVGSTVLDVTKSPAFR